MTFDRRAIADTTLAGIDLPRGHFVREDADAMLADLNGIVARIEADTVPEPTVDDRSAKWRMPLPREGRSGRRDLLVILKSEDIDIKLSMKMPGRDRTMVVTGLRPPHVEDRDALEWTVRSSAHLLGMALQSYDLAHVPDRGASAAVRDAATMVSAITGAPCRIGSPALGNDASILIGDGMARLERDEETRTRIDEIIGSLPQTASIEIMGTAETAITIRTKRVMANGDPSSDPVEALRAFGRTHGRPMRDGRASRDASGE